MKAKLDLQHHPDVHLHPGDQLMLTKRPARAELTLHDKHHNRDLLAIWVNDCHGDENGVILQVNIEGKPHTVALTFGDSAVLAKFITKGHT